MFMSDHVTDAIKVGGVNLAAWTLSFSQIDAAVKFVGSILALVYTTIKISEWVYGKLKK